MALPEIKHPIHKLVLPSTNKSISYRPFTVREEKLLLIARLSDDIDEVLRVMKQVVSNCILDKIDVDSLAMFDIEYIFINLRKVSVSNVIEMFYTEENIKVPFTVDLDQVKVEFNKNHTNKIQINEDVGIMMRYPSIDSMMKLEYEIGKADGVDVDPIIFNMILECIDSLYDDKKVYKDFSKVELEEFLLSLPVESMQKIKTFFDTMPVLRHETKVKLPDGTIKTVVMKGLKDFFSF